MVSTVKKSMSSRLKLSPVSVVPLVTLKPIELEATVVVAKTACGDRMLGRWISPFLVPNPPGAFALKVSDAAGRRRGLPHERP